MFGAPAAECLQAIATLSAVRSRTFYFGSSRACVRDPSASLRYFTNQQVSGAGMAKRTVGDADFPRRRGGS